MLPTRHLDLARRAAVRHRPAGCAFVIAAAPLFSVPLRGRGGTGTCQARVQAAQARHADTRRHAVVGTPNAAASEPARCCVHFEMLTVSLLVTTSYQIQVNV